MSMEVTSYLRFFGRDAMDTESTLDIVDQTEVLAGLLDGDHV